LTQVFPQDPNGPDEFCILNKHLYRTTEPEDDDKPAITIPFSMLRQLVEEHHKKQERLEMISANVDRKRDLKRSREEMDPSEEEHKDALRGVIKRQMKRSRV
jgi:hypothetical protein